MPYRQNLQQSVEDDSVICTIAVSGWSQIVRHDCENSRAVPLVQNQQAGPCSSQDASCECDLQHAQRSCTVTVHDVCACFCVKVVQLISNVTEIITETANRIVLIHNITSSQPIAWGPSGSPNNLAVGPSNDTILRFILNNCAVYWPILECHKYTTMCCYQPPFLVAMYVERS